MAIYNILGSMFGLEGVKYQQFPDELNHDVEAEYSVIESEAVAGVQKGAITEEVVTDVQKQSANNETNKKVENRLIDHFSGEKQHALSYLHTHPDQQEYPDNKVLYGKGDEQVNQLSIPLTDMPSINDSKEILERQIVLTRNHAEGVFLALQTLAFHKRGWLTQYQNAQKHIVRELAVQYVESREDLHSNKEQCVNQLVVYCSQFLAYSVEQPAPSQAASFDGNSLPMLEACSLPVQEKSGHIVFSEAGLFFKMVRASLSPQALLNALLIVDKGSLTDIDALKTMLCCNHSKALEAHEAKFAKDSFPRKVSDWNTFDNTKDLTSIPSCAFHKVHPHLYLPVAFKAIDNCNNVSEWFELLKRLLGDQKQNHHESYRLLVLRFKQKFTQRNENGQLSTAFESFMSSAKSIGADDIVILCEVIDIECRNKIFCSPNIQLKILLRALPRLPSSVLRTMPSDFIDKIPQNSKVQLIEKAVVHDELKVIECLWPKDIHRLKANDLDSDNQLYLKLIAVNHDRVEIVKHMMGDIPRWEALPALPAPKKEYLGSMDLFAYACTKASIGVMAYFMKAYYVDPAMCDQTKVSMIRAGMGAIPMTITTETSLMTNILDKASPNVLALILSNYDDEDKPLLSEHLALPEPIDTPQANPTLLERFCKANKLSVVKVLVPETSPISDDFLDVCIKISKKECKRYLERLKQNTNRTNQQSENSLNSDKNKSTFYKVRGMDKALYRGESQKIQYWLNVGVTFEGCTQKQFEIWLCHLFEVEKFEAIQTLLNQVSKEDLLALSSSDSLLNSLSRFMTSEENFTALFDKVFPTDDQSDPSDSECVMPTAVGAYSESITKLVWLCQSNKNYELINFILKRYPQLAEEYKFKMMTELIKTDTQIEPDSEGDGVAIEMNSLASQNPVDIYSAQSESL